MNGLSGANEAVQEHNIGPCTIVHHTPLAGLAFATAPGLPDNTLLMVDEATHDAVGIVRLYAL